MRKTKWSFLLTLMLVLSVFVAACTGGEATPDTGDGEKEPTTPEQPAEQVEQILNIVDSATIPTMDTVMGTDAVAFEVADAVFEGLYRLGENAQPVPGIAESHDVSDDGLVYTFNLRDAKWSDGSEVVAEDFLYTWRKVVNPETGSQYNFIMGDILNANKIMAGEMAPEELGVKAIDEKTLEVTLEQPVDYFLSLTAFPVYYPQKQEFVESQGEDYAKEVENLIFNGPFVLSEWKHEEGWTFKKNPDYWDADTVRLEQINVKVVKDNATAVNLYDTGDIDRVGLTSEFVDKYRNDPAFTTIEETVVFWLKMNQTRTEALANENIRKAIAYGVDRVSLTDVILNNGSIPAYTTVPKGFVSHPETGEDFNDKYGDFYVFDADKALEHWNAGLGELGITELSLEILGGDTETSKNLNAYLKDQLEKHLPGLTITLKEVPFNVRLDLDDAQDYDLQFAGWGPDYLDAMTFVDLWLTDGGHNKMEYSNTEFDKLVTDAKTSLTGAERFEAMQEAARIAMEDAAISPLYQRARATLIQPYVKGLLIQPFGPDYSYKWAYIEK
ncbi:peptide ABC transporter substrate-binding protein [Chengkuizengella sp. SCS-71B]|uniref:peptide ABC transporter substrate-binding protein n=1 Tax=Chengkuizengella sp. SCS-71B TaxID=3115290 RepID=UPI0032C22292